MKLGWETVPILRNRWVVTARGTPAAHVALKQTGACLSSAMRTATRLPTKTASDIRSCNIMQLVQAAHPASQ